MLIVTGSDDNYVSGVLVLISSAAFHNSEARFAVLDMNISAQNRSRIDQLGELLNVSIDRIEVNEDAFSHLSVVRSHLTRGTYLRFLIPHLFSQEDRVIYLDCDMVVMDSLHELDQVDLGTDIIAAVACPSPASNEVMATGHVEGSYINAGLLVMNLPLWRKENIVDKCMSILTDPHRILLSEDQSAINIVAKGRIKYLPSRYNVYTDYCAYKRVDEFPNFPAVLHYVVSNKPWNWATNLAKIWQFHARRICTVMPDPKKLTVRRKLSLMNRRVKMIIGNVLGRKKYQLRKEIQQHMNENIARRYLAQFDADTKIAKNN